MPKQPEATFSGVPFEIRAKIWKEVCSFGRDIDIRYMQLHGTTLRETFNKKPDGSEWSDTECYYAMIWEDGIYEPRAIKYYSLCPPPVALQVNHETREEAKRYYTLAFGSCTWFGGLHFPPGVRRDPLELRSVVEPYIWVNFEADRIIPTGFRDPWQWCEYMNSAWAQLQDNPIRRIAFRWNMSHERLRHHIYRRDFWEDLTEVTLIDPQYRWKKHYQPLPKHRKDIEFSNLRHTDLIGYWLDVLGKGYFSEGQKQEEFNMTRVTNIYEHGYHDYRGPWYTLKSFMEGKHMEEQLEGDSGPSHNGRALEFAKITFPRIKVMEACEGNADKARMPTGPLLHQQDVLRGLCDEAQYAKWSREVADFDCQLFELGEDD